MVACLVPAKSATKRRWPSGPESPREERERRSSSSMRSTAAHLRTGLRPRRRPVEALTGPRSALTSPARRVRNRAFSRVTLGFFDRARRDYARRVIREQVEVVSLPACPLDAASPGCTCHQWWRGTMGAPRRPSPGRHRGIQVGGRDRRVAERRSTVRPTRYRVGLSISLERIIVTR